jgi:hypothetical protein
MGSPAGHQTPGKHPAIQYDRDNFLYKRVAALSLTGFVRKFNNWLLFSTFL